MEHKFLTKVRGNWPGQPQPEPQNTESKMKVVKVPYTPPDKQLYTRGQGKYSPFINQMMGNKPGAVATECADMMTAKNLYHAAARYLKQVGKYDTLRPRLRKDAEDSVKVWIVNAKESA
jgi:hypothetical protein